jgi:hypothetical protein
MVKLRRVLLFFMGFFAASHFTQDITTLIDTMLKSSITDLYIIGNIYFTPVNIMYFKQIFF